MFNINDLDIIELFNLVERGDIDAFAKTLHEFGFDPKDRLDRDRLFELSIAIENEPSARYYESLLHCAIEHGFLNIVQYLIEYCGMDPNASDGDGCTSMHRVMQTLHVNIAQYLIEKGANINAIVTSEAATEMGEFRPIHFALNAVEGMVLASVGLSSDDEIFAPGGDLPIHYDNVFHPTIHGMGICRYFINNDPNAERLFLESTWPMLQLLLMARVEIPDNIKNLDIPALSRAQELVKLACEAATCFELMVGLPLPETPRPILMQFPNYGILTNNEAITPDVNTKIRKFLHF